MMAKVEWTNKLKSGSTWFWCAFINGIKVGSVWHSADGAYDEYRWNLTLNLGYPVAGAPDKSPVFTLTEAKSIVEERMRYYYARLSDSWTANEEMGQAMKLDTPETPAEQP